MQRGQNITLTPKGEKQVAVLFSAVMLLQFPVSERGEGVFVHSEPFGSPYICWRGSSLMGIGYQDKLILELAWENSHEYSLQEVFQPVSMREFCHVVTKIDWCHVDTSEILIGSSGIEQIMGRSLNMKHLIMGRSLIQSRKAWHPLGRPEVDWEWWVQLMVSARIYMSHTTVTSQNSRRTGR